MLSSSCMHRKKRSHLRFSSVPTFSFFSSRKVIAGLHYISDTCNCRVCGLCYFFCFPFSRCFHGVFKMLIQYSLHFFVYLSVFICVVICGRSFSFLSFFPFFFFFFSSFSFFLYSLVQDFRIPVSVTLFPHELFTANTFYQKHFNDVL